MRLIIPWYFIIIIIINQFAFSQIDKEFWFASPEFTGLHADRPVFLRISSFNAPAQISISFPASKNLATIPVSLKANSAISVDLTSIIDSLETWPFSKIKNTGMLIKSSSDISVYYEVLGNSPFASGPANTDIFSLKGHNALGTKFFTPFQTNWRAYPDIDAWASISFVATENNTNITIIPTQDLLDHPKGVPFTVNLQRGQNFALRANTQDNRLRPAGTFISSNKPIAVTINDDSMFEGSNWDSAGDQIIPSNVIGNEYIAIKAAPFNRVIDRLYICAVENSTEVFIGNQSIATKVISAGEQFETILVDSATYIKSSKPIYVFQVGGFTTELGGAILPPLACTGSKQVGFMRSNSEDFALTILVKSGGEDDFTINGNNNYLTKADFFNVKNTNGQWKYAKVLFSSLAIIPNEPTIVTNSTSNFHLAIMNGNSNTGFRFGYFSDFGFLDLGSNKTLCINDSLVIDAGFGKDTYLWSNGKTSQSIIVADSGLYSVKVTKENCEYFDEIRIYKYPPLGSILPNDTTICASNKWNIKAKLGFKSYLWNNGQVTSNIFVSTSGFYKLTVKDTNDCRYNDSTKLNVNGLPRPIIISPTNERSWCADSLITIDLANSFVKYSWNTGDSTKSITSRRTSIDFFKVKVTDSNGCEGQDSINIDCSPYITIPNVFTPNNDNLNDTWWIDGLKRGFWELSIVNRYGKIVYQSPDYDNTWNGEELSNAIYYYHLKHKFGKGEYKGWVEIIR